MTFKVRLLRRVDQQSRILDPDLDSTRIWMHWATLDAILICFELLPLLPPILDQSLLTVLLQFTSRDPS